jgi:hypothetical protein
MRIEQVAIPAVRQIAKRPKLAHALFRLTNDESPFDPDYYVDPYRSLEAVRAKYGQVYYRRVFRQWFVVGYDEALELLRSPSLSVSSALDVMLTIRPYSKLSDEAKRSVVRWLLFLDPPDHTRLRALVQRAFTPKTIMAFVASRLRCRSSRSANCSACRPSDGPGSRRPPTTSRTSSTRFTVSTLRSSTHALPSSTPTSARSWTNAEPNLATT